MATEQNTLSRRSALAGLGLAGAAAITPIAGASIAKAATRPDRSLWDREFARYRAVKAEFERRCADEEASLEAVSRECPRNADFFDKYALQIGMDREQANRSAGMACSIREGADHLVLYPREKRLEQENRLRALDAEAERIADEFMAFQARHEEARRRHNCEELTRHSDSFRQTFFDARDRIMMVPAPDPAALLVKIEDGTGFSEDYDDAIRSDARRLLASAN